MSLIIYNIILLLTECIADDEALSQSSGRIINDIIEIFAPSSDLANESQSKSQLPYGFNRLLSRSGSSGNTNSDPRRRPLGDPIETNAGEPIRNVRISATPWTSLAKDVIGLFAAEMSSTPRPTTTTQASIMNGLFNQV